MGEVCFVNDANPVFLDGAGWETNTAAEILWRDSKIRTNRVTGAVGAEMFFDWNMTAWHDVTINYDLVAGRYELYLDSTLLASNLVMNGSTIGSIAIGGAYLIAGASASFDYWHWQTSTDTAFTGAGSQIPEPATLCILGLGAVGLLRRRAKV